MSNGIILPKSDKRFTTGKIVVDKHGRARGNPLTVELKTMDIPPTAPLSMQLNPPLIASQELAYYIEKELTK